MPNRRTSYALTLGVLAVTAFVMLGLQPYSVRSPWQAYVQPARSYLHAALRHDSAALQQQSAGAAPVAWALEAARVAPESLAVWAAVLRPAAGRRWGDTTDVVFETPTDVCQFRPLLLRFMPRDGTPHVLAASSRCFGPQ
jgi:hypothetical protein